MDIFQKIDAIEEQRRRKHFLYDFFVSKDTRALNKEVAYILKKVEKTFDGAQSRRLKKQMTRILNDENRCAKHALVLFALWNDIDYRRECMYDRFARRMNIETFEKYLDEVDKHTAAILNGELICLQDYVEQLRTSYIVTCM